jgi:hypothetical protein
MLDKLSAKISHFGNYVLENRSKRTKSQKKVVSTGMVYGLKEKGGNIKTFKT